MMLKPAHPAAVQAALRRLITRKGCDWYTLADKLSAEFDIRDWPRQVRTPLRALEKRCLVARAAAAQIESYVRVV